MWYCGHLSVDTEANHEGRRGEQSVAVDFMHIFTVWICSDEPGPVVRDPLLQCDWSLLDP